MNAATLLTSCGCSSNNRTLVAIRQISNLRHNSRQVLRYIGAATPLPKMLLIGEVMLNGVASQFDVGGETHFFRNARAVGGNGLLAERQFRGDFLDGLAGRDHAQDLELAVGKAFVRIASRAAGYSGGKFLGNG